MRRECAAYLCTYTDVPEELRNVVRDWNIKAWGPFLWHSPDFWGNLGLGAWIPKHAMSREEAWVCRMRLGGMVVVVLCGVESWHLHQVVYWPGFPEACYKPQSLAALCMHWMVLPGWQWSWLHGSEPEGSLARRTQSASPAEGEEQVNLKSLSPGALPKAPLTLSMLCCRRSLPRTASCCLNSSFRGSAREGGGAIYR